jgi:hypothetical protein
MHINKYVAEGVIHSQQHSNTLFCERDLILLTRYLSENVMNQKKVIFKDIVPSDRASK